MTNILLNTVGGVLPNSLSHAQQNGGGTLGLLTNPTLPPFVGGGALPNGFPWGGITPFNSNPYTSAPNTGQTRFYNFNVAECSIAPDGVQIPGQLCINGQFPGPTIEADYGDTIQVTVNNQLPFELGEGTAMHWHGLLQTKTPWADGVPGTGSCPIPPGQSFTYSFIADLYGSSWYHAHYSTQYAGGLVGPMVIHGPQNTPADIDLGPVLLTDWYHNNYRYLVEQTMAPDAEIAVGGPNAPLSSNVLINGKGSYDCSKTSLPCTPNAGISKFRFQSGKVHKLRLVNTGSQAIQVFSIDNHTMTVISNDFVPVQAYQVNHVSLGVGQRADVLVNGTGSPNGAYYMRSNMALCSNNDGTSTLGLAAIYYENANTNAKPTSYASFNNTSPQVCANDPLQQTIPSYPIALPNPATTDTWVMSQKSNGTHQLYYFDDITYRTDYNTPVLQQIVKSVTNLVFPEERAVVNYGTNSSVRFIIINADSQFHPMHLHGHNMYVLDVGFGNWDGTIIRSSNPQRRDTQLVPPGGFMIVQWDQNNPGVWPFHCHIAWHLSAGLFLNILENPPAVGNYNPPLNYAADCINWNLYSTIVRPDQIDDGV